LATFLFAPFFGARQESEGYRREALGEKRKMISAWGEKEKVFDMERWDCGNTGNGTGCRGLVLSDPLCGCPKHKMLPELYLLLTDSSAH
jgi:hypothetical protein